eukprot:Nitzschia sp. Nitz4//scaffold141_size107518//74528//76558//NITZ4_004287-RA/size107518-processed-gene-0.114-mRNA-1//1//CDS//3329536321//1411//frame0
MPAEVAVAPTASEVPESVPAESYDHGTSGDAPSDDQGVEVVMDSQGKSSVMDHSPQDVFRAPQPVRPRAMRAGHLPPPHIKNAGSYGYPPSSEYGRPYPVPYAPSGSFDDAYHHQQHQTPSHYSPHVQYPPPGTKHSDAVNVISPNHGPHKGERPPATPSRRYGHYQYPPASPVSRPPGAANSPPRMRNYAMRRGDGPYSAATRGRPHEERGAWNHYASPHADRSRPPLVTESFDSDHYSSHASHPTTPNAPHYGPPPGHHRDPHYGGPGPYGTSFGGSFDSHGAPPPHFDDYRYYGHSPQHHPESPYSNYSYRGPGYSPGGYYDQYSPRREYGSYDDDKHYGDHPHAVTPNNRKKDSASGMLLPQAAQEIDFEVTDPPMEPTTPPSKEPVCESPADVNSFDVLCGRGGGTNSQIGNRRFRKLVQDFQPIYLLARRKEKPLLARTIVLIIRKRGGRFLKKDEETGELFEVGDTKAEAKTSQALREGLDVRATKNAASSLLDKKKKKKGKKDDLEEDEEDLDEPAPEQGSKSPDPATSDQDPQSPPSLPRLNENKPTARPPSPDQMQFRKRRRMRSADGNDQTERGCGGGFQDRFFSDFCPPRADLGRPPTPPHHMSEDMDMTSTPTRGNHKYDDDDDDIRAERVAEESARGCAGIAMDMVTGAATGSFCLGPRNWR